MNRPSYRFLRFIQSPAGRFIEERLWRIGPYKRLVGWLIWRELARDVGFMEGLAAGRLYRSVDGEYVPTDSWQPDDPIQSNGWRHDGTAWVRIPWGGLRQPDEPPAPTMDEWLLRFGPVPTPTAASREAGT